MRLELIPITSDNWRDAAFLTTDPNRAIPLDEKWVASNAFSLLQCSYDPDWDCRLMVADGTAVGFVFYGYWRERQRYLVCRYMIDVRFQNKGYGTAFLPMVVAQIRDQYGCSDVYVTVSDDNETAVRLYERTGFLRTEEMDEEERVYVLRGEDYDQAG